jgi:hypothetical protein
VQCGCSGKFAGWLRRSLSVALEGVELEKSPAYSVDPNSSST